MITFLIGVGVGVGISLITFALLTWWDKEEDSNHD